MDLHWYGDLYSLTYPSSEGSFLSRFTPTCASAIAHRNHYFKQYQVQGSLESKCLFHKASNFWKGVPEDAEQQYAASVADSIVTQRLGEDFWQIANSVLNRNKSSTPSPFHWSEVVTSPLDKASSLFYFYPQWSGTPSSWFFSILDRLIFLFHLSLLKKVLDLFVL